MNINLDITITLDSIITLLTIIVLYVVGINWNDNYNKTNVVERAIILLLLGANVGVFLHQINILH